MIVNNFLNFIILSCSLFNLASAVAKEDLNNIDFHKLKTKELSEKPLLKLVNLPKTSAIKTSNSRDLKRLKIKRYPDSSPELVKEVVFKNWTRELIEIQTILSRKNFKKALNERVCPQLEVLEKKTTKAQKLQANILSNLLSFMVLSQTILSIITIIIVWLVF